MFDKIRSRREAGVTFFAVFRAARQLVNDPEFTPGSEKDFAEKILEKIIGENLPQARIRRPEIDWDALLEFIMAILPLILALL